MVTQRNKKEQRQDMLIGFGKEYNFTKEQLLAKKILPALVYEKGIDNGYSYYFSALNKLDSLDEKYLVHNDPSTVQQKQNTLIRFGKEYNFTKEQLLAKKILPALVYEKDIDNGYGYYLLALNDMKDADFPAYFVEKIDAEFQSTDVQLKQIESLLEELEKIDGNYTNKENIDKITEIISSINASFTEDQISTLSKIVYYLNLDENLIYDTIKGLAKVAITNFEVDNAIAYYKMAKSLDKKAEIKTDSGLIAKIGVIDTNISLKNLGKLVELANGFELSDNEKGPIKTELDNKLEAIGPDTTKDYIILLDTLTNNKLGFDEDAVYVGIKDLATVAIINFEVDNAIAYYKMAKSLGKKAEIKTDSGLIAKIGVIDTNISLKNLGKLVELANGFELSDNEKGPIKTELDNKLEAIGPDTTKDYIILLDTLTNNKLGFGVNTVLSKIEGLARNEAQDLHAQEVGKFLSMANALIVSMAATVHDICLNPIGLDNDAVSLMANAPIQTIVLASEQRLKTKHDAWTSLSEVMSADDLNKFISVKKTINTYTSDEAIVADLITQNIQIGIISTIKTCKTNLDPEKITTAVSSLKGTGLDNSAIQSKLFSVVIHDEWIQNPDKVTDENVSNLGAVYNGLAVKNSFSTFEDAARNEIATYCKNHKQECKEKDSGGDLTNLYETTLKGDADSFATILNYCDPAKIVTTFTYKMGDANEWCFKLDERIKLLCDNDAWKDQKDKNGRAFLNLNNCKENLVDMPMYCIETEDIDRSSAPSDTRCLTIEQEVCSTDDAVLSEIIVEIAGKDVVSTDGISCSINNYPTNLV